jgi:hypothetical protein
MEKICPFRTLVPTYQTTESTEVHNLNLQIQANFTYSQAAHHVNTGAEVKSQPPIQKSRVFNEISSMGILVPNCMVKTESSNFLIMI